MHVPIFVYRGASPAIQRPFQRPNSARTAVFRPIREKKNGRRSAQMPPIRVVDEAFLFTSHEAAWTADTVLSGRLSLPYLPFLRFDHDC